MKITFCLPSILKVPSGGFKIVFEFANRLSERGHEVFIVCLTDTHYINYTKSDFVKYFLGQFRIKGFPNWFSLNESVKVIATPYHDGRHFPNADIVIATALRTSFIIKSLPREKGEKYYFIQGFENWGASDDEVFSSYQLGLRNIVVSTWLKDIVEKYDRDVALIPNAIDSEKFFIETPIESRSPYNLSMLYHTSEQKGIPIALAAIRRVKRVYPETRLHLFGVSQKPDNLDDWMTYTQNANEDNLRAIYNNSSIYVCASSNDGFGLTGAESMACGCALASTGFQGVFEYAKNNNNALISPVNDPKSLADNIIRLISDDKIRIKLAKQGSKDIKSKSWEKSVSLLESVLMGGKEI